MIIHGLRGSDNTRCDYTECDGTRSCRGICLERLRVTATLLSRSPDLDKNPGSHAHGAGVLQNGLQNSVEVEKRKSEIDENNSKVIG